VRRRYGFPKPPLRGSRHLSSFHRFPSAFSTSSRLDLRIDDRGGVMGYLEAVTCAPPKFRWLLFPFPLSGPSSVFPLSSCRFAPLQVRLPHSLPKTRSPLSQFCPGPALFFLAIHRLFPYFSLPSSTQDLLEPEFVLSPPDVSYPFRGRFQYPVFFRRTLLFPPPGLLRVLS